MSKVFKCTTVFGILLLCAINLRSQSGTMLEGTVTFTSSQSVYVKFKSTEQLEPGDTLLRQIGSNYVPALVIRTKSSSSVVADRIEGVAEFKRGDKLAFPKKEADKKEDKDKKDDKKNEGKDVVATPDVDDEEATEPPGEKKKYKPRPRRNGRISAGNYSNFSPTYGDNTRMRYAFIFRGENLKQSRFSTDNYVVYRHTLNETTDLADAFKVYSLSGSYNFSENTRITLGRRINQRMSSVGAIDGLQFERGFGPQVKVGLVAGSRPNIQDYSVDFNLMQGGLYFGLDGKNKNQPSQLTVGFMEQRNGAAVDRRYTYLQHSAVIGKFSAFSSAEVDLYQKVAGEVKNEPRLTNLFVSARYNFSRKVRVNASYDTRRNTLFYESYKLLIDSIFDQETRQGVRFGLQLRPLKLLNIGINSGLRFQESGANNARNLTVFASYSRVPFINSSVGLTANFIQTNYLEGQNYGVRLNRYLLKNKVGLGFNYRYFDNKYSYTGRSEQQHLGSANLSFRITRDLSIFVYGERVFQAVANDFTRFNARVIQRF